MLSDAVLSRSNEWLVLAVEKGELTQRLRVVFYTSLLSDGKMNLGRRRKCLREGRLEAAL